MEAVMEAVMAVGKVAVMVAAVQEAVTAVEVVGRRRGRWWRLLAPAKGGGRRAERGETAR